MRHLIVAAAVSIAAVGGTRALAADEPVRIAVFKGGVASMVEITGVKQGIFAKHGLNAELLPIASGPNMVAAVIAGDAEFVSAPPPVAWPLIQKGTCFKYLATGSRATNDFIGQPTIEWPSKDLSYPQNLADIKGKTVGVTVVGGPPEQWARSVLKEGGIDPDKDGITFVTVGGPDTAIAAFQSGRVDVLFAGPPIQQLLDGREYTLIANTREKGSTLQQLVQVGMATSCDYAQANPDVVKKYCAAISESYAFMNDPANDATMNKQFAEWMNLPDEVAAKVWATYKSAYPGPKFTRELWERQVEFLPASAEREAPDYDTYVDAACLPE